GDVPGAAVRLVLPAVVLAAEVGVVPLRLAGQETMPVGADVQEGVDLAVDVADQQRPAEQLEGEVVARPRQVGRGANHVPGGEHYPLHFQPVLLLGAILVRPEEVPQLLLVDKHGQWLGGLVREWGRRAPRPYLLSSSTRPSRRRMTRSARW